MQILYILDTSRNVHALITTLAFHIALYPPPSPKKTNKTVTKRIAHNHNINEKDAERNVALYFCNIYKDKKDKTNADAILFYENFQKKGSMEYIGDPE